MTQKRDCKKVRPKIVGEPVLYRFPRLFLSGCGLLYFSQSLNRKIVNITKILFFDRTFIDKM